MRFSFKTAQQDTTWRNLEAFWREADDIDVFYQGWLFDHFRPVMSEPDGPCYEAWTVAAGVAAVTDRLRIGHMVTANTFRHPALAAKMAVTVDHISNGRVDFGLGTGWLDEEHEAYGIDLPPLAERFDRFDEALEVVYRLFTETSPTYEGVHYQLKDALFEPKAIQRPHIPIVIGGRGERRTLRAVARYAAHYNYPGWDLEDFRRKLDVLATRCSEFDRDLSTIHTSIEVRLDSDYSIIAEQAHEAAEASAKELIIYIPPPHEVAVLDPLARVLGAVSLR